MVNLTNNLEFKYFKTINNRKYCSLPALQLIQAIVIRQCPALPQLDALRQRK